MKKNLLQTVCFALCISLFSCTSRHFLKDEEYRTRMENDFKAKQTALPYGNLFNVFSQEMSTEEREAMTFLYAYMTPGDITDYPGEFYLKNVRLAFGTRESMPWGPSIPDIVFRHFVLPVRINNENMDNSREVFLKELTPRIKGLSMYDAVLEVNHWCHEKAVYAPTDSRTSSPLATIKTAYGRCGEESTLLVAALRSVGIPARQVYTPRWAHTDDNHAWVEAWVDGKWYFLGACEPEPVLNLGWFNAPASRSMLMHTKVFGSYNGPEEVMKRTANYTEINIIDNYGTSAHTTVTVKDTEGRPVPDANVEFKLYNYAEFYTVSRQTSDKNGQAQLSAGLGDLLVFASAGNLFGYRKISFGKDRDVTVTLSHKVGDRFSDSILIVPPAEKAVYPQTTEEQVARNARRMQTEDSIRNAYIQTFPNRKMIEGFAKDSGLNTEEALKYITGARGNYEEIMRFLSHAAERNSATRAFDMLGTLSEKDLRDTPCSVLEDHLYATDPQADVTEILAPRIASEMLTPYRSYLQKHIQASLAETFRNDPQQLVNWCRDSLTIRNDLNTLFTTTSPEGVWKSRVTDSASRNIFFVASARSLGIPAWIDEITGNVCFRQKGEIRIADFEAAASRHPEKGKVKADYRQIPRLDNPKYYSHFTIAKILPEGTLQTLNFESGSHVDMGLGSTWSGMLKRPLDIDEGHYMLVTGTRMAKGSVLAEITFFNVEAGKTTPIKLEMRESKDEIQVIGNFNSENKFKRADNGEETSLLATTGRGYYIVAILGARQEPTNHAMRDIAAVKDQLEAWGRGIVLLFPDEKGFKSFDPKEFGELPNTITYGIDIDGKNQKEMVSAMKLTNAHNLPIFIIADTFNRVVFVSQGYTIGLGEQLMQVIHKL